MSNRVHQDELEREIERLKQKVGKGGRSSKSGTDVSAPDQRLRKSSTNSANTLLSVDDDTNSLASTNDTVVLVDVCEICEKPGHDIFTCPLLKDDLPTGAGASNVTSRRSPNPSTFELFCVDCEGHGHLAADCPHSLDVF